MRVRTTIVLLLLLVAVAFVAGLNEMRRYGEKAFERAVAERQSVWRIYVADFLERQHRKLATLASQHVSEEDGVDPKRSTLAVLLRNNPGEAKALWDDEMWKNLRSFDANAIWIYRADGTLFYSHSNTEEISLERLPSARWVGGRTLCARRCAALLFCLRRSERFWHDSTRG
jgi:hypothetical protein